MTNPRQRALMGLAPKDAPGPDRDLDRILRLYEIIKRYELLVQHLLVNQIAIPFGDPNIDMHVEATRWRQNVAKDAVEYFGSQAAAARGLNMSLVSFIRWRQGVRMTEGKRMPAEDLQQQREVETV